MKIKTSKKFINQNFTHILNVGYCKIQHLLIYQTPDWYISSTNGWDANIYQVDNVAIATGYQPFGDIKVSDFLIKKYDAKAKEIYNSFLKYEEKKEKINSLLKEFILLAIKEAEK